MRPYLSFSLSAALLAGGIVFIAGSAVRAERGHATAASTPGSVSSRVVRSAPGELDTRPVSGRRASLRRSAERQPDARATSGKPASLRSPTPPVSHAFAFTRGIYSGYRGGWGRGAWATDYPKADRQFLTVLRRLTNLDAFASENAVALDDPELRRFPLIYMLEVGSMSLRPEEAAGLRGYLLAGGFAFIDDFWGTREWRNFEQQMRLVLPEHPIVELPLDHPIFSSLYQIRELVQVPAVSNWRRWRQTHESDGYVPHARAILDHDGRLMVMINWNTDIGDAWEWAEQPDYPLEFSTYAYQIGANAIVYAMSH